VATVDAALTAHALIVRSRKCVIVSMLEFAAAVAGNALRAHHVAIQGDFFLDETDQVTAARVLAHACDQLGQILDDYRRRVVARLARERRADPF
jgi:hypothetical protein